MPVNAHGDQHIHLVFITYGIFGTKTTHFYFIQSSLCVTVVMQGNIMGSMTFDLEVLTASTRSFSESSSRDDSCTVLSFSSS